MSEQRDWDADLALCEAALQGPVTLHEYQLMVPTILAVIAADLRFIATARQGWPAALRKIKELEAELAAHREVMYTVADSPWEPEEIDKIRNVLLKVLQPGVERES